MTLTRTEAAELVARLREWLARATQGPWLIHQELDVGYPPIIHAPTRDGFHGPIEPLTDIDKQFIVAAVNALPALLDFIEQHLTPTKDDWRCVNCKRVISASMEPERCPVCRCSSFAHIDPSPPKAETAKQAHARRYAEQLEAHLDEGGGFNAGNLRDLIGFVKAAATSRPSAREAVLREALEPFARVAEHDIGDDEADGDTFRPMSSYNRAPLLTVGDFRRARAALRPTAGGGA